MLTAHARIRSARVEEHGMIKMSPGKMFMKCKISFIVIETSPAWGFMCIQAKTSPKTSLTNIHHNGIYFMATPLERFLCSFCSFMPDKVPRRKFNLCDSLS